MCRWFDSGSGHLQSAKIKYAIVAQLVEYNLAKVGVAGSSPVYRSHAGVVQW